ncbi:cation:proton antiporter [Ruminiclostridium cellobioparum]|uniref:Sodium/hydrogen exchanger n=1 Tax=Ruminiclostridium cellobioparum subsp. termitidis CT1112 TaxID=1195236 RepID=S0FT17_RUMCE|nr:cation:proton antiporter [Ruminiclostridium cellobioparum]EMS71663.1 sodium/hydrogen exchanger [Ruminiclostridium cellobioparum subsp. termitidis CT1112]
MEKILLEIALILIFTKIGGLVSRKFKMPEVLGALVAGVILGPAVLSLVEYTENIKLLSELGVIMLMFLAGLETNVDELKKAGKTSFVIALSGVIIPLVLGTAAAYLFFTNFWENLFVGVILTATSVSISVETLTELGKLNTKAGVNILGAAVIDDVLGLILISIVLAVSQTLGSGASGSSAAISLILTFAKIIAFCLISVIMIAVVPKFINKISFGSRHKRDLLPYSIAMALLLAFISEILGIAAITGAYICGLTLSQFIHKEYIEKNVKAISSGFLSLIFFASVGIAADIKGLDAEVILITLVMFAIAVIGKLFGCGGAARLFKISKRESLQIGVGMISRGEVAIITANIGMQNHIISEEIYIPTLIVVILTTVITPALLKIVFNSKKNPKESVA